MPVSQEFLDYIFDQFSSWREITIKKMFGGAGLFSSGKMFGLVADDIIYFKVDGTNLSKYTEAGSKPFKPFPKKPPMKSYYELPPDVFEDQGKLVEWAEESLTIQKKKK